MTITISDPAVRRPWLEVERSAKDLLLDYEQGGPSIGVYSEDNSFVWTAEADASGILVYREGVAPIRPVTETGITEVALGFDASMREHLAYVKDGTVYLRYWNSLDSAFATLSIPDARSPRLATNDKRPEFPSDRDLILAYMKGSTPCVRYQRDRFSDEEEIVPDADTAGKLTSSTRIITFGRNRGFRLQWRFSA